jgi:hypothetical protein
MAGSRLQFALLKYLREYSEHNISMWTTESELLPRNNPVSNVIWMIKLVPGLLNCVIPFLADDVKRSYYWPWPHRIHKSASHCQQQSLVLDFKGGETEALNVVVLVIIHMHLTAVRAHSERIVIHPRPKTLCSLKYSDYIPTFRIILKADLPQTILYSTASWCTSITHLRPCEPHNFIPLYEVVWEKGWRTKGFSH